MYVCPCACSIARFLRVINRLNAAFNQRASLQECNFNRRESRCGKLHYIAHCGDDPRGDASTCSGGAPAAGVASTASGGRRSAGFPCRFAWCFLAFCDFSPAQARKMRLFLCKREGVFGSRRQCPRISIHAPPRGATPPAGVHPAGSPISIHAPPRGATTTTARACSSPTYVNTRPSARGDRPPAGGHPAGTPISIHAPPRGATGKRYAISANLLFNPYKSAWLNNSATQFVEIILVIFHRIIA